MVRIGFEVCGHKHVGAVCPLKLTSTPSNLPARFFSFQYLGIVLVFAVVYTTISKSIGCNLQLTSIREGFLFSLETMTTVGYGTHDYLFGRCWIMLPMLSLQACIGLLIDAFLIGILFARLSRPQTRANTVVFTKNAVIRRVRGEAYFM